MSGRSEHLQVGWQSHGVGVGVTVALTLLATAAVALRIGPLPGLVVLLGCAVAGMSRLQWAELDGAALLLRDARAGYSFRMLPARNPARVRFHRSPLPWCRVGFARDAEGLVLVLRGPRPDHPSLRRITMWMIVHGRRRARIDPRLLDALAAVPEHGAARQPHDASHA